MRSLTVITMSMVLAVTGCASMPGGVSTNVSSFDGTREVFMEPAPVPTPGNMLAISVQLGAHWSSSHPNTVELIARIPQGVTTIQKENGLQFNISGEITSLSSDVTFTEIDSEVIYGIIYTESSRSFIAPLEFVEELASANSVGVRLRVGQNQYYEAHMESGGMGGSALRSLNEFLINVYQQKATMQAE